MDRRFILAGLAAVTAWPVVAQQAPVAPIPVTPQPSQTQTNPSLGTSVQEREQRTRAGGSPADASSQARQSGAAPAAGQQQSEAAARYIQDTLAAGTLALQTSIFARDKAQDPGVKRFARFEEEEQNTLTEVLHSMSEPSATASTGAVQAASTAPVLSPQASAMMERFSRAQAGPEFDRMYVTVQIQGHQNLLEIQERFLQGATVDRDLAAIARLAAGRVREHLAELQTLEAQLGR